MMIKRKICKFLDVHEKTFRDIRKTLDAQRSNKKWLFLWYRKKIMRKYHILIRDNVTIGEGIFFPHPQNIIIGTGSVIGNDCTIYHNVTLGKKNNGYPTIGNHVVIYPGAIIIGNIRVGDNSVIGANAVVVEDVPDDAVVGGVPAKVIRIKHQDEIFA